METAPQLPVLDRVTLISPLRRALESESVELTDWQIHPLSGTVSFVTGGVYRVTGRAHDRGTTVSWRR